jgi:hypothetical protein
VCRPKPTPAEETDEVVEEARKGMIKMMIGMYVVLQHVNAKRDEWFPECSSVKNVPLLNI